MGEHQRLRTRASGCREPSERPWPTARPALVGPSLHRRECTGVRTHPFAAHAWVEAEGNRSVNPTPPGHHRPLLTVPPADGGGNSGVRKGS
ncbi:lasso peptide biosynthesis B2 protein [Streptomyces sp. BE147]|nr:lasso peptide biosynthesis B2 protein [Streptomyces sp. BE147]MEE1740454.1 lasso peptide biosynthesis B2 protein [Streptomyces sp. BE147]